MLNTIIIIFLIFAVIAANLPWVTDRLFGVIMLKSAKKSVWLCILEWFVLYLLIGTIALGLEKKFISDIHPQDWEFYASTLCLFLVFALPGFIYRFDLKHLLQRSKININGAK